MRKAELEESGTAEKQRRQVAVERRGVEDRERDKGSFKSRQVLRSVSYMR